MERLARRRVRGLRREEVATAAGISATWYTWLEQGRPVRVSTRTLQAIGRALHLAPAERAHLLRLARAASETTPRIRVTRAASASLLALVTNLSPHPAYAVNGMWDVVSRNRVADAVFGDFDREPGITDNVLRRLFLDPEWRKRFENWEEIAVSAVAQFRAATGHMIASPAWNNFVATLCDDSPLFAEQWAAHAIAPAAAYEKVLRHPGVGRLSMLYATLAAAGVASDVRITVYMPTDAASTNRIRELADGLASEV